MGTKLLIQDGENILAKEVRQQGGKTVDPYLVAPNGKKLRSNVELLNFIVDHPEYWSDFNPKEVNFERSTDEITTELSPGTMKLVKFIDLIASGMDSEEALGKVCERKTSSTPKKKPEKGKRRKKQRFYPLLSKSRLKKP